VDGQLAPNRDRDRELAVLRIAHEALHNALRHAGAQHIAIHLTAPSDGASLTLDVSDDGTGFDPASTELRSRHLGLTSMEERARELGGRLEIRSRAGAGTTVRLEVPPHG
jgi:signal transduction histidine kinase